MKFKITYNKMSGVDYEIATSPLITFFSPYGVQLIRGEGIKQPIVVLNIIKIEIVEE